MNFLNEISYEMTVKHTSNNSSYCHYMNRKNELI